MSAADEKSFPFLHWAVKLKQPPAKRTIIFMWNTKPPRSFLAVNKTIIVFIFIYLYHMVVGRLLVKIVLFMLGSLISQMYKVLLQLTMRAFVLNTHMCEACVRVLVIFMW